MIDCYICTSPTPQPPRGEAHEAERSGRGRAGRAGQAGPTRRGTAHEERRTSEPMRQDRASRAPHQSRATTERRPAAAAEAQQASSSSPARGQRQTIQSGIVSRDPPTRPSHRARRRAPHTSEPERGHKAINPERLAPSADKAGGPPETAGQRQAPPEPRRGPQRGQ